MGFAVFVSSVCSLVCAAAVVFQSRIIIRLMRENTHLVTAINSLMIEAVWPPHE